MKKYAIGGSVDFRAGVLSVEVTEGAWDAVLHEVTRRAGIRLHLALPLEGTVTASFTELPVECAMKRLFGPDANFIFLYPHVFPSPPAVVPPSEVWVLSREGTESPGGSGRTERPTERLAAPTPPPEPDLDIEQAFERHPQLAHDVALNAVDVEQRLHTIAYLGQHATPQGTNILLEVLHDDDPHIRESAVEALGLLATSDPQIRQALVEVLQTALEAEVQQLVTDVLGSLPEPTPAGDTVRSDPADMPSESEAVTSGNVMPKNL